MEKADKISITVQATIDAPIEKVWSFWTDPAHITKWNHASEEWHSPYAENDLKVGGKFLCRMEAKDGSAGFDFWGIYDAITPHEVLSYTLGDNRKVKILFSARGHQTHVLETFEAEDVHAVELQKEGWQAILNAFKKYVEQTK